MTDPITPRILPGDHETLTEKQRRSHYAMGCRHDYCRAARMASQRERKARKKLEAAADEAPVEPLIPEPAPPVYVPRVSAQGSSRRLQALCHIGYTPDDLGRLTGLPTDVVWWLLIAPPAQIRITTHTRIAETFRAFRITPVTARSDQARRDADRAKALADRAGWAGPFDWDDIDTSPAPSHTRFQNHAISDDLELATA